MTHLETLPGTVNMQVALIQDTLRDMTPTTKEDADRLNLIDRQLVILCEEAQRASKE